MSTALAAEPRPTRLSLRPALLVVALVCALGAPAVALGAAYRLASADPSQVSARYALFWLGMLTGVGGCGWVMWRTQRGVFQHVSLLALGIVTYIPKLARGVAYPVQFDEKLHVAQTQTMIAAGHLHVVNTVVPAVEYYPGLHLVLWAGTSLTSASVWQVGVVVAGLCHLAMLVGLRALLTGCSIPTRIATLAAGVYALSPGYTFFTSQVAYETLALPLAIAALACAVRVIDDAGRIRRRYVGASLGLIVATGVTHHLSALVLTGALVCLAVSRWWCHRDRGASALGALSAFAIVFNVAWIELQSSDILSYVLPHGNILNTLLHASNGGSRGSFAGSLLPAYEQWAGRGAPIIASALIGAAVLWGKHLLPQRWLRWPILLSACAYPASVPLVFSQRGLIFAHRSWPFTWLAVAPAITIGLIACMQRFAVSPALHTFGIHLPASAMQRTRTTRRLASVAVIVALGALLVGNTATEVNDEVRFPGPYVAGGDARWDSGITADNVAMTQFLHQETLQLRHRPRIIADNDTAMSAVLDGAEKVSHYPAWDLLLYPTTAGWTQMGMAAARHVDFMIVDQRLLSAPPVRGYYIDPAEPRAYQYDTRPLPPLAHAFDALPWAQLVFTAGPLQIYAIHPELGIPVQLRALFAAKVAQERATIPPALLRQDDDLSTPSPAP